MKYVSQEVFVSFFKKTISIISAHKIATTFLIALFSYGVYHFVFSSSSSITTLQYVRVKRGDLLTTVNGTGQVTPSSQVDLKPKVNANVVSVLVRSGDQVKQGQVLFRLDARDAYKQVRDQTLALEQAEIALEKLKQPAETLEVLSIQNAIKKAEASKVTQDTAVKNAYNNLLSASPEAVSESSYTNEIPPTISGSYTKGVEGRIKITVYGGGGGNSLFEFSGVASGSGTVNAIVPQPIGDTGLFIKFNTLPSQTNWVIDLPNKRSSNYLSLSTAYQNALLNRDTNNADYDRVIAENKLKLEDLTKGAKEIDIRSQELAVQQRRNSLIDAQNNLADYTITAPFAGTMASVSGQVGLSAVVASASSGTSLGTIITTQKIAQITLNEADIAKVSIGQMVNLSFDAVDGLYATGTVAEIDGLGTVTQGVVSYKVKIVFGSDDARIKSSMSVSAEIVVENKKDVLLVPNQAVKKDSSGYYVETDSVATSTRLKFDQATSSEMRARRASSTESFASSTRTRRNGVATSTQVSSSVQLIKVPVIIGSQNDSQTEIVSGLNEYQQIVVKKTVGQGSSAKAPSVTSLIAPSRAGGRPN